MLGWWLVTWTWAAPLSIDEVPNPRARDRWITDHAGVLDEATEARLEELLAGVHRDTTAEVAVVTVQDTLDEPKAFATGLFNHWGIGDAQANNGLLVLLVMERRRLEMETGYGLEGVLTDGWLGSMQAQHMVPHFKAGDFGAGLAAGLEQTAEKLRANEAAVREGATAPPASRISPTSNGVGEPSWVLLGGATGSIGVLGLGGWWYIRRRERTCPDCNLLMEMIPEHLDDEELTDGEQFEEQIGSVDYQIYVCPQCTFSKTIRVATWFSGYSDCHACGHRARSSTSTTVRSATYDHGGLVRVDENCAYCNDSSSYTRSTPRLQRSSSSSSGGSSGGGGGSFGGGSSGGGGAGSSW